MTKSWRGMNIEDKKEQGERCEIAHIWEILGRRWALLVLKNLSSKEVIRFNELKRLLPGISTPYYLKDYLNLIVKD